jgi:hypothetical protein
MILDAVQIARLACSYAGDEYKKKHLEKKKTRRRRRKRPGIVSALGPFNKGFACGPLIDI